jgi:RNA polymerase sigma-70 factor (ECF subfamily)
MVTDKEQARLGRARAFDRAAIAGIYDDYHEAIYRYCYRQVSDVEIARDLSADVFRRFLQALKRGNGPADNVRAWLFRTAHNVVIDHYRLRQHRQHLVLEDHWIVADEDTVSMADRHLNADRVRQAMICLTPEQHQVIALKFLAGLSNQEVASIMNKPTGAVKSLQHRALAALRRHLTPAKEKA